MAHGGNGRSTLRTLGTAALGCLVAGALGAFVGLMLAGGTAYAYVVGALQAWEEVPLPRGVQASRFVVTDTPTAYVETVDGRLFGQGPNLVEGGVEEAHQSGWDSQAWHEVEHVVSRDPAGPQRGACSRSIDRFFRWSAVRKPRRTADDQVYCRLFVHSEMAVFSTYVLLDNGETWRWSWSSSGLGGLVVLIGAAIGGALVGSLVGALVFAALWARRG